MADRLLDMATRSRVAGYLVREGHSIKESAQAIIDAEAYLRAAAASTEPLTPSPAADLGWHALILHTRDYAALCERLGGFIHHVPAAGDCQGQRCFNGDCSSGR